MVLIKEYRITLPMKPEEFQIGQLYSIAKSSNKETHDDAGVEVIKNEPFEDNVMGKGQYTYKIYHLGSRLPGWLRTLAPANALILHEESWNAFPYCKTILTSPFMPDKFKYIIETRYFENDKGEKENALNMDETALKKRKVEHMDFITQPKDAKDYNPDEDPTKFKSKKTGRGLLKPGWQKESDPIMCAYKAVTVEFKMWGVQKKAEEYAQKMQGNIFLKFHKQVFCWIDEWYDMTLEDIRKYEDENAALTNKKIEQIKEENKKEKKEKKGDKQGSSQKQSPSTPKQKEKSKK